MPVAAGSAYYVEFITCSSITGAAVNADSLPTAVATRNGVDDASFSLAVANMDAGRYKVSGTVPSGLRRATAVQVGVAATVASISGEGRDR